MLYPSTLPNLDLVWNDRNPQVMEQKFRYLFEPAMLSSRCYYLQLLTQVARAQAMQGKFAAAHATLDSVEADLTDGVQAAQVRYLVERARVFLMQEQPENAEPLLEKALKIGERHPSLKSQAQHLMARVEACQVLAHD